LSCLAIIVNYHGARDVIDAVQSLVTNPGCDHIHVVDNSVSEQEANTLRTHLPAKVQLTIADRNLGFAGACNLAFSASNDDLVLLLNPDARLTPNALVRLREALVKDPALAAVAPGIYWDSEGHFALPALLPEEPAWWLASALVSRWPASFGPAAAQRWLAWQKRIHMADGAQRLRYLSGAVMLLRRSAVNVAGGLFDGRYFMFFEDTDLSRRLCRSGFKLALFPSASAIHHWRHRPEKLSLMAQSAPLYIERHFPWLGRLASQWGASASAPFAPLGRRPDQIPGRWGLGRLVSRPLTNLGDLEYLLAERTVLSITPSPLGFPAIFQPDERVQARLNDADWQRLDSGRYLILAGDRRVSEWIAFDKVDSIPTCN
jgi:GT2 family glycosyltransferase